MADLLELLFSIFSFTKGQTQLYCFNLRAYSVFELKMNDSKVII